MHGTLSPDSPVHRALSSAADLVIVNILTLLGCVPIVTAGASLVACSRVTMEMARDEESYIVRSWWKAFRQELPQSLGWWVPALALLALAWAENWLISGLMSPAAEGVLTAVVLLAIVLIVALICWLAPLAAFFDNTLAGHVGNAALLMIGHLWRTVACVGAVAAPAALFVAAPGSRVAVGWFMVLIGAAFVSYLHALVQLPVINELRAAAESSAPE